MNQLIDYIKESWAELAKVTWPNRNQAIKLTVAVVVFSVGFSLIIGGLDWVFTQVLQKLILKG